MRVSKYRNLIDSIKLELETAITNAKVSNAVQGDSKYFLNN